MITDAAAKLEYERAVRALEYSRANELEPRDQMRTDVLAQNVQYHREKWQAIQSREMETPMVQQFGKGAAEKNS